MIDEPFRVIVLCVATEVYAPPCKQGLLQKETGHQLGYALYQNWCPVMANADYFDTGAFWESWVQIRMTWCISGAVGANRQREYHYYSNFQNSSHP